MSEMKRGHDEGDSPVSIDLSELEVLYGAPSLGALISRALEHFDSQLAALDVHLAARAYTSAAQALHQLKGTASFFASEPRTIDVLHAAEDALRAADALRCDATLPEARQVLASLRRALAERVG